MTARDVLRIAVLKTNPYWPFSVLNRMPYWLAVKCFVRTCSKFKEIRSVYLRHALITGNWTPALSDIDLTVLVDGSLSAEAEFAFLRNFWPRFDRLKKFFPMFGEIEILNEDHLDSWAKFGIEGQECSNWQLLAGCELAIKKCRANPGRISLETFDFAFWFYLQQLTDLHFQPPVSHYLLLQDLLRVERKIDRCLSALGVYTASCVDENDRDLCSAGVLLAVLQKLQQGLTALGIKEPRPKQEELRRNWLLAQARKRNPKLPQERQLAGLSHWAFLVSAIYLDDRERAFIIVKNADDSVENLRCIEEVTDYFAQRQTRSFILTPDLFAYHMNFLQPYEYARFLDNSNLIFGEDCLVKITRPGQKALIHSLLKETPLLLMFPRSQEFMQPDVRGTLSCHDLEYKLDRALALKLYLQRGTVKGSISEMLQEFDAANPRQALEIARLRNRIKGKQPDRELFVFFKGLIDDIHGRLASDDCWESSMESAAAVR